jgi:hypothetical protein
MYHNLSKITFFGLLVLNVQTNSETAAAAYIFDFTKATPVFTSEQKLTNLIEQTAAE